MCKKTERKRKTKAKYNHIKIFTTIKQIRFIVQSKKNPVAVRRDSFCLSYIDSLTFVYLFAFSFVQKGLFNQIDESKCAL